MNKGLIVLTYLVCQIFSAYVYGQNWIGNVSSDWNNPTNWSSAPSNGSDLTISSGGAFQPSISANSTFSPATITVQNGGVLTIGANVTTSDDVECIGTGSQIIMNAGNVSINPGGGGRMIIDLGSSMTVNGGILSVDERLIAGADALITITNGTVTSGERLLMDAGGRFIQDGGTVSVAQTFAAADGSVLNNSGYTLNSGSLTVTGEMAFENEAGNFEPYFIQNGGNLTLNGDLVWFGEIPGSGTPRFIANAGQTIINGTIHNLAGSTVNLYLNIAGTSTFTMNGPLLETINLTDSVVQTGGSFTWNGTNQIINTGVFFVSDTTTTFNGSTTLTGTGSYQFHHVNIPTGGTLTHLSPTQIAISGDIIHNGSFVSNQNLVTLNGSLEQTISGANEVLFNDLTVQNGSLAGVSLSVPISVSGYFDLINGKVNSASGALVKLLDNALSSAGNQNSFVNGPFLKIGDDAFVFPIGKNDRWRRLSISAPTNVTDNFIAEYMDNSFSSISPVNAPLSGVSNLEYWNLEQSIGTSDVSVNLYWEDASQSAITDCNDLSIAHWNGASWDNVFSTTQGSCAGNGSGDIISTNLLSSVGVFTFGFFSGVTTQNITICQGDTLQVGTNSYFANGTYIDYLLDQNMNDSTVITNLSVLAPQFTANSHSMCEGDQIVVGTSVYTTEGIFLDTLQNASGCDSIVESTIVVILPDTSVTLNGIILSSNNVAATSFSWVDCANNFAPIAGENQSSFTPTINGSYALVVTENGCADTSSCYVINSVGLEEIVPNGFSVYPNPTSGIIYLTNNEAKSVHIRVLNLMGELLLERKEESFEKLELEIKQQPGMYFVEIIDVSTNHVNTFPIVKE